MLQQRLNREDYLSGDHLKIRRKDATSFPLHAHDFFELEIVLSGSGRNRVNGKTCPFRRGSLFLLSPADFHSVEVETKAELWNIVFDETLLTPAQEKAIFAFSHDELVLDEPKLKKIDTACSLLSVEVAEHGSIRPLLDYVLSLILPAAGEEEPLPPMRRAVAYVQTHFRENPTLSDAARVACLSPVYFGNRFKQEMNETYVSYLTDLKLSCAQMLLKNGMSVTDACFASGFGSLSGFLHAFKHKLGMAPAQYKAEAQREAKK